MAPEEVRFAWEEAMFGSRRGGTVIGSGLKIVGNVTAEGLGSEPNQVVAQS